MLHANRGRRVLERLLYRPMAHTACSRRLDGVLERASQFRGGEGRIDILSHFFLSKNHFLLSPFKSLSRALRFALLLDCIGDSHAFVGFLMPRIYFAMTELTIKCDGRTISHKTTFVLR
jgi:hypothetical protein